MTEPRGVAATAEAKYSTVAATEAAVDADADAAAVAEAEKQQLSFERSLAGPSVGKAGLMRDQTEVNRIIAEASKGSKFYINQVRKDKELTQKISWFKSKRDELLRMTPAMQLEADADRILMEVEATRDISQTIVHVDMDAFYAAVEVQRDPSLKGKAFGVGRGVLCTASYEARKFGCRSGMAGFIAKKLCPHIILTNLHFDLYSAASKLVRDILVQYDENLMMAGLDEGYLNITPYMKIHNMKALEVVDKIRAEVEEKTLMTLSAGIAPNRMLAKICSDKNKPNGVYELVPDRETIVKFMRDLPVRRIPGFGRVTERCLEGLGVETCGDIFSKRVELIVMDHWFGFRGLCKAYLGISDNHIEPYSRDERKSVGVERTFRDKVDDEDILEELGSIAEELERDLDNLQYSGKTVTVKYKLHTFESKTRAMSVKKYISTKEEILPIALDLMRKELPVRIRLLGIRLTNLKDMTIPHKGIKSFFRSRRDKSPVSGAVVNAAGPSEESFYLERQYADDMAFEDEDFSMPTADISENPNIMGYSQDRGKRKADCDDILQQAPHRTHDIDPICPICGQSLDPDLSNAQINEHVDWCLSRDALSSAGMMSLRKPSGRKEDESSTDALEKAKRSDREAGVVIDSRESKVEERSKDYKRSRISKNSKAKGSVLDWLKGDQ